VGISGLGGTGLNKSKCQSPNDNSNPNAQMPKLLLFVIGGLSFDIVWDLEFGAYDLSFCGGLTMTFYATISTNYYDCL
jgi:hypothetical protein